MTIRTTLLPVWFGLFCLVCVASPATYAAGQVEVEVKGDFPALQDNADIFIGDVTERTAEGLRRYAPHAISQIQQAFKALGYYSPEITWNIEYSDIPELKLTAIPGEPVRIESRDIQIKGDMGQDPDFSFTPPASIAPGKILNHSNYESTRKYIENRAQKLGYFEGKFTEHRLAVDPEKRTAAIQLVYVSGPRYKFGDVSFDGDTYFEQKLIDGFVEIRPGDPYDADKVAELDSNLSNSGYFGAVVINASGQNAENRTVPVNVRLSRRDPRSVAAGVGFSTDVGPRVRGTWAEHWINPMGHRRGAEAEISEPRQNLSAWYELPLDPPMTDAIRFTGGYQYEDIEDVVSERLTFGQQWRHQLDNEWLRVLSLRYEKERYNIGDEPGDSRLLLPGISYSKIEADNPMDPNRGYRLQLDVTGATRNLASTADVLHVLGIAKGLVTFADKHRFLVRAQAGAVGTNDFDDVPPSLRFFAGGDQSVRGYGYETLTPKNADDDSLGGRYLLVGSMEYQYALTSQWRLATFYDRGNAVDNLTDPLATGVGVGIRWVSPVGPLRLDVAKGLDEELGGGWRLHFSMGPEL